MQREIDLAITYGAIVVASAGNDRIDLATDDIIPCELDRVICVGSVDGSSNNVFNFGDGVDIWAPTGIFSTVTPASSDSDSNDTGSDEISMFGGTSASAPFVAGIIALMKALKPDLTWGEAQNILQQTANTSSDILVRHGYVDAYRAVQAVRDNPTPNVVITHPDDGNIISYRPSSFRANANDPDTDEPTSGVVTWTSNRDGQLCVVDGLFFASLPNHCNPELTIGTHVITAVATDHHGASSQDTIIIEAINHAPTIQVAQFPSGSSLFSNQTITLSAFVNDVDENFDQNRLRWSSNFDGFLGLGSGLQTSLSVGTHTLTAIATDEMGSTAEGTTSVTILSGVGVPVVQILPMEQMFAPNTMITFRATANDPEDGNLSGASLQWSSSIDGPIGIGNQFETILSGPTTPCNPESVLHTITLRATDIDGNVVIETIQIRVGQVC